LAPLLLAASLLRCNPEAPGMARISLALDGSLCKDFCAETIGAAVYRPGQALPIGPEQVVPCGDPMVFDHIPGGQRVAVQAWVMSHGGTHLLEGQSEDVTVVANDAVTVPIDLQAVRPPTITTASLDAVAPPPEGAEVTLSGTDFGNGEGLATIELDGTPAEVVSSSWSDTSVRVRLRPGDGSLTVRVRNCGVASAPFPLRVVAAHPGSATLQPQGCPEGPSVHAVARLPGTPDLLLAASCQSSGYLQRFLTSQCAFSAVVQRPLPGRPLAIAPEGDGGATWVALEPPGGLLRVPISVDQPMTSGPTLDEDAPPWALAWAEDSLWVLGNLEAGPRLFRVRDGQASRFENVPTDLGLHALAAAAGRILLAASNVAGEGRLVVVTPGTTEVRLIALTGCLQPKAVAGGEDGTWAVVGCGGASPGLAVVRLSNGNVGTVDLPNDGVVGSLAMDMSGGVAFGWDYSAGNLLAADLAGGTVLGTWHLAPSLTAAPLIRLPNSDTLMLAGPLAGSLTLFSPYQATLPCSGEAL
jgi:hypothetical protein